MPLTRANFFTSASQTNPGVKGKPTTLARVGPSDLVKAMLVGPRLEVRCLPTSQSAEGVPRLPPAAFPRASERSRPSSLRGPGNCAALRLSATSEPEPLEPTPPAGARLAGGGGHVFASRRNWKARLFTNQPAPAQIAESAKLRNKGPADATIPDDVVETNQQELATVRSDARVQLLHERDRNALDRAPGLGYGR
jgi:hypothetical protein